VTRQDALWSEEPNAPRAFVPGEVRRALDRDIKAARAAGRTFLETELAAVRRQANDLDRLERILQLGGETKTWDYNPKTTAHQAYMDSVRRVFGDHDDDDDPFLRVVREIEEAARARAAEELDATRPDPPD
jgi:hypothetical protein